MAKWCYECARKPYIGCDASCPIFGKHLEEVAEDYFELKEQCERWKKTATIFGDALREYQQKYEEAGNG